MTMKPVLKSAFSRLMKQAGSFGARPFIAVAASGGRDSLALVLLMNDWIKAQRGRLVVLTVDHGLRKESKAETLLFQRQLKKMGIACEILTWRGAKPKTGIQEAARNKRYELLLARCKKLGVSCLALAHQEEDQAETFLIRLLGGSGLDGLCGMKAKTTRDGIAIIRPLLTVSRASLAATCKKFKMTWIDDPSNENVDFRRVRVRSFLAGEGVEASHRIALAAGKLSRVRDYLDEETQKALALSVNEGNRLDLSKWRNLSPEIRRRVVVQLIHSISGSTYSPRQEKLEALLFALEKADFKGRTLGGCLFGREKSKMIAISKENI